MGGASRCLARGVDWKAAHNERMEPLGGTELHIFSEQRWGFKLALAAALLGGCSLTVNLDGLEAEN